MSVLRDCRVVISGALILLEVMLVTVILVLLWALTITLVKVNKLA